MERNESFSAEGLHELAVRLAWAQLEIYTDDIGKIQVIASGDEHTVKELRMAVLDGVLEIEQPQYGLSLDITHGHWMQISIRVPKAWGPNPAFEHDQRVYQGARTRLRKHIAGYGHRRY